MSGECDKCGEHCLDCICASLRRYQQNDLKERFKNINCHIMPLEDCIDAPAETLPFKWVNVCGRKEHEAILKDSDKCKELGLDQVYETFVYLKSWGGWLED